MCHGSPRRPVRNRAPPQPLLDIPGALTETDVPRPALPGRAKPRTTAAPAGHFRRAPAKPVCHRPRLHPRPDKAGRGTRGTRDAPRTAGQDRPWHTGHSRRPAHGRTRPAVAHEPLALPTLSAGRDRPWHTGSEEVKGVGEELTGTPGRRRIRRVRGVPWRLLSAGTPRPRRREWRPARRPSRGPSACRRSRGRPRRGGRRLPRRNM